MALVLLSHLGINVALLSVDDLNLAVDLPGGIGRIRGVVVVVVVG